MTKEDMRKEIDTALAKADEETLRMVRAFLKGLE